MANPTTTATKEPTIPYRLLFLLRAHTRILVRSHEKHWYVRRPHLWQKRRKLPTIQQGDAVVGSVVC